MLSKSPSTNQTAEYTILNKDNIHLYVVISKRVRTKVRVSKMPGVRHAF